MRKILLSLVVMLTLMGGGYALGSESAGAPQPQAVPTAAPVLSWRAWSPARSLPR